MIYGLWQSAAGMQVQQYRQSILANNLANVDTPGFKPDVVGIVERPLEAAGRSKNASGLSGMSGGLFETAIHTNFSPGGFEETTNPLDLAVEGDGFFRVQTPTGPRVTRDGRLTMRHDGTLVTAGAGHPILARDGNAIRVDPRQKVVIDTNGEVRQGPDTVGRIDLVDFADRQLLTKIGRNLFDPGDAESKPARGVVRTNSIETSGTDSTMGLVQMIAAARAYEMNATMVSLQDSTLGKVVNDLGRLG